MNNLQRLLWYYGAGRIFIPRPRYFIYNATLRCDLHCRHCGIWENRKKPELAPADLDKILARDFFSRVETAWLTGGEPTLRKDLGPIAGIFRKRFPSMRILGIATNGYAPERILSRLDEISAELDHSRQGIFIQFSIDGLEEVHDRIRGPDAFTNLTASVEAVKQWRAGHPSLKVDFGFNCVVQPENVAQLKAVKDFAEQRGAGITFNVVAITDQIYYTRHKASELAFRNGLKRELTAFLQQLKDESGPAYRQQYQSFISVLSGGKRRRRCLSLYSTFIVNSDGTWIPCPLCSEWERVDFRETDPGFFWKSSRAKTLRRRVAAELCPGCLLSCSLGDSLSFLEFIAGGFE